MLKSLFKKADVRPKRKRRSSAGNWVISAHLSDVELGLQEMIDAIPESGGEVVISGGTYEISEPIQLPDRGHIKLTGCTIIGDKKKPRTIVPASIQFEGKRDTLVYWDGRTWKAVASEALRFKTKEGAEKEAFALVAKAPKFIASVEVIQVTL